MHFYALLTVLVYLFALCHHLAQAGYVDLPTDGALALGRAVDIANFRDLPTRGNSIEPHYWFGVADDYLLAPFLIGASSLEAVLRRTAMFHSLCAPMAVAIGLTLRRPLLGLLFGFSLAALPDLVHLTGSYPLNYRTTHWALLALLGCTLMSSQERTQQIRQLGASVLLLAASLAVASHPFGLAALPAALLVCASSRTWPRGSLAAATLVGAALCLVPYFASNLAGLEFTLFERGSDTRAPVAEVLSGSLSSLHNLAGALHGLPGGLVTGIFLLSGGPLCLAHRHTRPALALCVLWTMGAYGTFVLAGYPPKTWHLRPCLYLALGLGFIGWAAATGWLLQRAASLSGLLELRPLQWAATAGICLSFLVHNPVPLARAESSPARGFGQLSEAILELSAGRSFQYLEAQSNCPLNWSAEATLLDLHLRSGDFSLGTHKDAPLLAAIERIPTFETHRLASPSTDLSLSNGLAFRLHWNLYPQAWREQFLKYCPTTQSKGGEDPFYFGGPGSRGLDSPCWTQNVCAQNRRHANGDQS